MSSSLDARRLKEGYCLGIESTADDFAVGIVSFDGEILANVISAYSPEKGGIHPREAARHHANVAAKVIGEALERAGLKAKDLSIVAFAQGPGLGPCLRTGATAARALASYLKIPLVGVNHCIAHIEIGRKVCKVSDPVTLYVSGGNTIVTAFAGDRYRVFGETLDIAIGNCLDTFAREVGLTQRGGVPFGAMIENLAKKGKRFIPLPYTVKGMDLSFSGLLTRATQLFKDGGYRLEDLCFSLQEVAFSMLTEVTERAVAHTEKREVLLTGGVAANRRLQDMLRVMTEERGAEMYVVPKQYALDNGVMIAWTGILRYRYKGALSLSESGVRPKWRVDEVDVPWRRGERDAAS